MIVRVPQFAWHGDTEFELTFPPSWNVNICQMAGQDAPKLNERAIRKAFVNPIGTPRISELARDKKEVVIIFDDLSRPTKVAELVPYVLEELETAGIKDENIRFVAGIGAHSAMKPMDYTKKLGADVVCRFPVYNHNPYANCSFVGNTSRGTPLSVNSEVLSCDLKIALGVITPHPTAGFGGGAKMLLPGVAHIDSIWANHFTVAGRSRPTPDSPFGRFHPSVGIAKIEDNPLRLDAEEAGRMAGLDIIVNVVTNLQRDTIGLFVGDLVAAHREGVKLARKVYATKAPEGADVVIVNAYSKANEANLMMPIGSKLLKKDGGDMVVLCNTPEGQICHYLVRSFGKNKYGRLGWARTALPARTKRMIVLGTYIDRVGLDTFGPPEQITVVNSWAEILDILKVSNGDNASVAVVPDATIQYFPELC